MNKKILLLILFSALILPLSIYAWEVPSEPGSVESIGKIMSNIVNTVWMIFSGIGTIMMVVSGIWFLTANGDPGKLSTAKNAFIWGVIGVGVGIVAFSIITLVEHGILM